MASVIIRMIVVGHYFQVSSEGWNAVDLPTVARKDPERALRNRFP